MFIWNFRRKIGNGTNPFAKRWAHSVRIFIGNVRYVRIWFYSISVTCLIGLIKWSVCILFQSNYAEWLKPMQLLWKVISMQHEVSTCWNSEKQFGFIWVKEQLTTVQVFASHLMQYKVWYNFSFHVAWNNKQRYCLLGVLPLNDSSKTFEEYFWSIVVNIKTQRVQIISVSDNF